MKKLKVFQKLFEAVGEAVIHGNNEVLDEMIDPLSSRLEIPTAEARVLIQNLHELILRAIYEDWQTEEIRDKFISSLLDEAVIESFISYWTCSAFMFDEAISKSKVTPRYLQTSWRICDAHKTTVNISVENGCTIQFEATNKQITDLKGDLDNIKAAIDNFKN